ncbi:MAG: type VI secretion system tip protein VgrG, partial [Phycisphaerae bacterium]
MAIVRDLSEAQLIFQLAGGEEDQFLVIRFRGQEGLCQLYRFEIDLVTTESSLAFDEVVGKAARLSVQTSAGQRWFHGIISRFELADQGPGQWYYRAEMVPMLWLLTHRYRSRIFQQKKVTEIISDVLTKAGIPSDRVDMSGVTGTHEAREYCVQYRETDYNFICRLMEEEGIWWYFAQTSEGHTLVLADSAGAYAPIEGESPGLNFVPPKGMLAEEEHVYRFRLGQSVRPGAVVLRDFNFEKPALDLEVKGDAGRDKALEFSDYPGEYQLQAGGTELARLRAEEFESGRVLGTGQSNSYRLAPGRTFELAEHPTQTLNRSYLVTSVLHQAKQSTTQTSTGTQGQAGVLGPRVQQSLMAARQSPDPTTRELAEGLLQIAARLRRGDLTAHRTLTHWLYHAGQVSRELSNVAGALGRSPMEALAIPNLLDDVAGWSLVDDDAPVYDCRFECIPADVTFRPPRVTPWPVMRGSQTARVVGPKGEEIHTDQYGRVKVQFHWDREGKFDDSSSCWIRVSQGMAGGQYGMMFLPRIGQEVIVDFLEGDPDKPIITGRVYNADHMPPYPLPDEKTKSVIETRTSPGGEGFNELRFEDLKDKEQIFLHAQKDLDIRVLNDEKDWVGRDKHEIIKGHQKKSIAKSEGRIVGGDQSVKVGGNHTLQVKGDSAYVAEGKLAVSADGDLYLVGAKGALRADDYAEVKAPTIHVEGDAITLKSGGSFVKVDSGGVTIFGSAVNINSGGSAGSSQSVEIANIIDPAEPLEAATGDPGKDTVYEQEPKPTDPFEYAPEYTETEKHWIGIRLFDDNGAPLAGERYVVLLPDGTHVARGSTDVNGEAEIRGIDPGNCQVTFPDLDGMTWKPGPPPAGAGGAGGAAGGLS